LKLFVKICDQTTADGDMVTNLQPIGSRQCPIRWYYRRSPMTYRLATILHNWHTIVHYDPPSSSKANDLRHLKANMRLPISN